MEPWVKTQCGSPVFNNFSEVWLVPATPPRRNNDELMGGENKVGMKG